MEEQMEIILTATDDASPVFESVADAAEDLKHNLGEVGEEGTDGMEELGDGADQAEEDVRKLGDEAKKTGDEVDDLGDKSNSSGATMQMAFQNIADGVMRAKEGVVELGRNLMETLSLAGQQEQQETFLKMNIGAEGAAKQMKIINDLVAELPGDDVAIGGLLSQAAAKNAGITADELKRMGDNAADYFAAMSNYGKSSVEAQQDLTNYILTGNTAELERSPILQAHIDKLKEATTVEERNKALQEAMNEEGWSGISQQDTYNNKLETFTAMLDRGKRQMGEMFLDAAGGAMDFIGKLDEATGGVLGIGIAAGSVTAGPLIDMFTGVGQIAMGVKALREAYEGLAITEAIANAIEGEGAIARMASAIGITTEAAAAEGATIAFGGLAIAEGAALWPILAIIAAVIALGVAIYELGKYFGWWTSVGSVLEAINAGVQRLWSAFVNHPDIQAIIRTISNAWNWLSNAVGQAINSVLKFFNINVGGEFDIVRALIDVVSAGWTIMKNRIITIINVIRLVIVKFVEMKTKATFEINKIKQLFSNLPGAIRGAISTLKSVITKPFTDAKASIDTTVGNIIKKAESITNISLSGLKSKLTKPFTDAWESISKTVESIKKKASSIGNISLPSFFGGEDLEFYGGEDLTTSSYTTDKLSVDMNQNINLSLDLRNVPSTMDERALAGMINETLDSKEFITRLVNNPDFQSLDGKVKQRIVLKSNRANGRGV